MSEDNLTVHILRELREDIRSMGQRLDRRLDAMDQRFDAMDQRFDRLESSVATRDQLREVDLRLWTRIAELNAASLNTHHMLEENFQLRDRVERCEHDIAEIKDRLA